MNDNGFEIALSAFDWAVVAVFMSMVIGFALYVKLAQRGSEDYFLAGRSMGWTIVMISTFATLFSTISFVAVPGEAYSNGLLISLMLLSNVIFYPIAIVLFLKFFFYAPTFTAYEYLERRYNLPARLTGSAIYSVVRLMYTATVFYAAAQVFEALVGWPPLMTILVIGAFTIVYTATGGMKAVMWTDTIQGTVVIFAIGLILYRLLDGAGFDVVGIYQHAADHGRGFEPVFSSEFYRFNLYDRVSFWLILIGSITVPLWSLSADQSVIQRLLAAKGYHQAKWAVFTNAMISIPIVGMLWLIGIALFYYYQQGDGTLPEGVGSDQILGFFINTELPTPIPGLITAGLLAALMSTIDSTVNCIANVFHRDWLVRLRWLKEHSRYELPICRTISVVIGTLGVGLAVVLTLGGENISSTVLEVAGIWGSLWGVLLMAFLLGVLVRRVSGPAIFIGLLLGGGLNLCLPYLLYYAVPAEDRISFMWVGVPGMLVAGVLPLLLSIFWPNRKDLSNLTLWTLRRKPGLEPANVDGPAPAEVDAVDEEEEPLSTR